MKILVHPVLDPLTLFSKHLKQILLGTNNDVAGKSRADLWELAALVALDLTVERANRACDLDFHARHQVSWLAHIWKAHSAISHLINR